MSDVQAPSMAQDVGASQAVQHDHCNTPVASATDVPNAPSQGASGNTRVERTYNSGEHPFERKCLGPGRVVGIMTFGWLNGLFRLGSQRTLEADDFFVLPRNERARYLTDRLATEWKRGTAGPAPVGPYALLWACCRMSWAVYAMCGTVFAIEAVLLLVQAWLLGELTVFVQQDPATNPLRGYMYALGMTVIAGIHGLTHQTSFFWAGVTGYRLRTACIGMVYRKALAMRLTDAAQTTTGHVVNLVSNDVERFIHATPYLHFLWIAPLQAAGAAWLMWKYAGAYTLIGFAVVLLMVPYQMLQSRAFAKLRLATAKLTDSRVRMMAELLGGIQVRTSE